MKTIVLNSKRLHEKYFTLAFWWWRQQMETFFALLALCEGESTGYQWIPLTKTSDAELWCFLWCAPEKMVEQTIETPVIWDAIALIMTSLYCYQFYIPVKWLFNRTKFHVISYSEDVASNFCYETRDGLFEGDRVLYYLKSVRQRLNKGIATRQYPFMLKILYHGHW